MKRKSSKLKNIIRIRDFFLVGLYIYIIYHSYFTTLDEEKHTSFRLPTDLKPYNYEIAIKPYIGFLHSLNDSFKFDGNINISFTCLNPTNKIVLHIKDLTIINETIKLFSNRSLIGINQNWVNDFEKDFMILTMNEECLRDRNYTLSLLYRGEISEYLSGFYRSSFTAPNGSLN